MGQGTNMEGKSPTVKTTLADQLKNEGFSFIKMVNKKELPEHLREIINGDPRSDRIAELRIVHVSEEIKSMDVSRVASEAVRNYVKYRDRNREYGIYIRYQG